MHAFTKYSDPGQIKFCEHWECPPTPHPPLTSETWALPDDPLALSVVLEVGLAGSVDPVGACGEGRKQ